MAAFSFRVQEVQAGQDDRLIFGCLVIRRTDPFVDELMHCELGRLEPAVIRWEDEVGEGRGGAPLGGGHEERPQFTGLVVFVEDWVGANRLT